MVDYDRYSDLRVNTKLQYVSPDRGETYCSKHLGDEIQPIQMFCPPSERPRAKAIASDYQLKGVTPEKVSNSPYLGVSISENLENASKANSTLG